MFSDFCDFRLILAFPGGVGLGDSFLVPGHCAFSSFFFHSGDELLLAPSDLRGEVAQGAELAEVTQFDASHGVRHAELLLSVVGGGNALEHFEAAQSSGSTGGLVRDHASDGAPEDTGGSAVVHEGAARVG